MKARAIRALLPAVFAEAIRPDSPLEALLQAMEVLHARSEVALGRLETYFDPRRAPDRFVPFLAGWVGIDFPVTTGLGRLRELAASAVALSKIRGTREGLVRFLETATGVRGFVIDEGAAGDASEAAPTEPSTETPGARPFHIRVVAPGATRPHRRMIRTIVEREKPAYVTYDLEFTTA